MKRLIDQFFGFNSVKTFDGFNSSFLKKINIYIFDKNTNSRIVKTF